ncbi:hypothetical protein Maes01_01491 [Microbulbifer aestuariivivens]|uniref:Uncharacterized protein n=1 Tax=Microbulbifer aestuariivivens TaxID=1908308 RepID=A0ABP9WNZ4_9GAMM
MGLPDDVTSSPNPDTSRPGGRGHALGDAALMSCSVLWPWLRSLLAPFNYFYALRKPRLRALTGQTDTGRDQRLWHRNRLARSAGPATGTARGCYRSESCKVSCIVSRINARIIRGENTKSGQVRRPRKDEMGVIGEWTGSTVTRSRGARWTEAGAGQYRHRRPPLKARRRPWPESPG